MAGKYKPYPAYKPSGVEWLGDIPAVWSNIQIGRLFHRLKRTGYAQKQLLSVYRDHGVVPKSSRDDNNNKASEDLSLYQLIEHNDLVLNKMKTWQGSIAISDHEGIVSPAYFVYKPEPKLLEVADLQYVHFLLRTPAYISQYLRASKGIRVNQWDLDPSEFQKIELLLPPLTEQTKIAAFLEYETAKIDALIVKQQRLIELLEEKRQAVISHAVTKGLNPNVPMRPSGIDWLGDVPEHWEVKRLRDIGSCQNGINIGAEFFGTGSPFISYGDVYKNAVLPTSVSGLVRSSPSDRESYSAKRGDVFFTRTSETIEEIGFASTCLEDVDEAAFAGFLIRFRPFEDDLIPEYSRFYFRMNLLRFFFVKEMNLITRASLSQDLLKQLPVLLPPKSEQISIARFLAAKYSAFESLVYNAKSAVELLKERRAALISAVVTGKIDVRDWQPQESKSCHKLEVGETVGA